MGISGSEPVRVGKVLDKPELVLDQFIYSSEWPNFCPQARMQSEAFLGERPEFMALCDRFLETAQRKLDNRVNQIRLWLNRLPESQRDLHRILKQEMPTESAFSQALLSGMYHPRNR